MANLHITEFDRLAVSANNGPVVQIASMPPLDEQTVAIGASSAASSAFNASTRFVCLTPKADCHIQIGATPTATTSLLPLTAGQVYYFGVTPGHKVAVIQA
jgi:hypothetical protein